MANIQDKSNVSRPPDASLQMDYWSEELSEAQKSHYSRSQKEYSDIMRKVSDFIFKEKGDVLERGDEILVLQGSTGTPAISSLSSLVASVSGPSNLVSPQALTSNQNIQAAAHLSQPQMPKLQTISNPQLVLQGQGTAGTRVVATSQGHTSGGTFQTPQGTFQIVMDPRLLHSIVGARPNQQGSPVIAAATVPTTGTVPPLTPTITPAITPAITSTITPALVASPPASLPQTPAPQRVRPKPTSSIVKSTVAAAVSNQTPPIKSKKPTIPSVTTAVPASTTSTVSTTSSQQAPKQRNSTLGLSMSKTNANENTSIGGLSAGNSKKNSNDDNKSNASGPDSKELTFNKMSGKTFPSLVVLAKPHLKVSEMSQIKINKERSTLDAKVKNVLMYNAAKFCEWLIEQGLVKSDQFCTQHPEKDGPLPLKLGTYSDVSKFPYSGGYVWINDCCPQRFVSVFSGSIFEGAPHPPSVLLKLMYHWCCQTNVQNVVQWVKVDNFYVKNFFTLMRSVCIAAVHENFQKLGGPQKRVEVGVISLGTTSQDGNQRQVKVEVLGVMDMESKLVRLRAVEPLQEADRNYKRRFVKILEPLRQWVHLESTIVTDYTVDRGTLMSMGFKQVIQTTLPDPPTSSSKMSNQNIMEYLRRIVPRMFQNTLSLLSRQIIQQFLDELVWREQWGPIPSLAFETLVSNLAAQTKLDKGENLIIKLGKIAANPFRCWDYHHWCINGLDLSTIPIAENSISFSANTINVKTGESATDVDDEYVFSIALPKPYQFKVGEELENRINEVLKNIDTTTTLRKLVEKYHLPRSLLYERSKDFLKLRLTPAQSVFTEDEEEDVKEYLMTLYEWGFPFARWDVQMTVKQYLDACGRVEHRFKNNCPGEMWLERFLTRHPLIRARLCNNTPSRSSLIDPEAVKQYMLNISSELEGVPPQNILNFMEIGLTGDPLKSMSIELRDLRYPIGRRKVKSSTAIMVACTALGKVLPIFIIFEGKATAIEKGDFPGEYCATVSGWFDDLAFQKWMETVLFPWADQLEGKKVVVGDSLAKLFTVKSLALCIDKNITFVSMPCNISGVLSPIDVVLCEKLRTQWRVLTRSWALSNGGKCISLENYPSQIQELFTSTIGSGMGQQIRNAFKVIGLHPFNSKNTMRALENAGVNLNESRPSKQSNDSKVELGKRKRIYIGADDPTYPKKRPEQTAVEPAKESTDLDENLKTAKELTPLVTFYYGTLPADKDLASCEFKVEDLNAKCSLCSAMVQDNLTLMKHLLGHSEQPSAEEILDLKMCIYCAKVFPTSEEENDHVLQVHKDLSLDETACLICSEKMESRESLILHMRRTHHQLELPFSCTICGFRSSEQFKLVDHFYEVHKNGEKLQCPHCLKCVAVGNQGKKLPANVFFYSQHVKKHQQNTSSKKCDKCSLMFMHKGIIKEHLNKDHISLRDHPNIVPYSSDSKVSIMIPVPKQISSVGTDPKFKLPLQNKIHISVSSDIQSFSHFCIECHSDLFGDYHFVNDLSCHQCSFSTCCSKAMKKHALGNVRIHPEGCRPGSIQTAVPKPLANAMHCMCGFQSRDGNTLATHLISCNRTVAYPSASAAVEALVARRLSAAYGVQSEMLGAASKTCSKVGNGKSSQNKSVEKDPQISLSKWGLQLKKSLEGDRTRVTSPTEFEDDSSRDRPLSRASSTSSSSTSRKRSALEARIESPTGNLEVKEKKSVPESTWKPHSQSDSNHSN